MKLGLTAICLLSTLLMSGCSLKNDDPFVNKDDIEINVVDDGSRLYKTDEELNKVYSEIEASVSGVPASMEEYHQLRVKVNNYVNSSIVLHGNLDNVFKVNDLIMSSRLAQLDQDIDGVMDIYEIFIADTSPFRKISDERTNKNDGTAQTKVYLYSYGDSTTPIIFGNIIRDNIKKGYLQLGDCIEFDLLLRSNELKAIHIKCNTVSSGDRHPVSFIIEGLFTPTVRGTATFYHHNKMYSETNYVQYNNTVDDYLERSREFTRTVSELFTNTEYILHY